MADIAGSVDVQTTSRGGDSAGASPMMLKSQAGVAFIVKQ
jgi:hypothetical protein